MYKNVKKLNATTKQAQRFITAYKWSNDYDIMDAYERPSNEKIETFREIKKRCEESNGTDLKVISSGCQYYSTGFRRGDDLIVDTFMNVYIIKNAF